MFPQHDTLFPETRFTGFTTEWERRRLGDVTVIQNNMRIPITAQNRITGKTPYYGANGIQDYVDGYTHDGENVLIAEDGANSITDYPVTYTQGKIWVNNHAHVLKGNPSEVVTQFLAYILKTYNFSTIIVGGGRSKLNKKALVNIKIKLPQYNEQYSIGSLFATLDKQITLEQQKLQNLQTLKKSLLKAMFV